MDIQTGKHAGGRPTKYDAAYCERVIGCMADGYSFTAFAGFIGVSRATLNVWAAAHPEFLEALNVAKAIRLRFWEQQAISVASKGTGGPGAASVIIFGLKNMGGDEWADKSRVEHSGPDGKAIQLDDATAAAKLAALLDLASRRKAEAG